MVKILYTYLRTLVICSILVVYVCHLTHCMDSAALEKPSLGSRPSPYARVLIVRGWANLSSGKAWDDSLREA